MIIMIRTKINIMLIIIMHAEQEANVQQDYFVDCYSEENCPLDGQINGLLTNRQCCVEHNQSVSYTREGEEHCLHCVGKCICK